MKRTTSLLVATVCLFFFTAVSAEGTRTGAPHERFSQGNPAIKQYVKEHIVPVIKQKRLVVEQELSATEKDQLATARTSLKQLHQQEMAQRQQKPKGISMHEYMQSDEQKAAAQQTHQQMKTIMEGVKAIANNHLATLDNIHTQLEPAHKQWMEDIAKLKTPNPNAQTQANPRHQGQGQQGQGKGHPQGDHRFFNSHDSYAHFLLIPVQATGVASGDSSIDEFEALLTDPSTGGASGTLTTFQVLPNPASNELVASNAQIPSDNEFKVIDMQGRIALSMQNIQPAQHIDISSLPSGNYIVQLKGNGQSIENKLVIAR